MPQPRRRLPAPKEIPWAELRRRGAIAYEYIQRGWNELTVAERNELTRLLRKSRGRPKNLTRDEARRFGKLVARAARGATRR